MKQVPVIQVCVPTLKTEMPTASCATSFPKDRHLALDWINRLS